MSSSLNPLEPAAKTNPVTPSSSPTMPLALRTPGAPVAGARSDKPQAAPQAATDRQLVVGREIVLSGQINSCDSLVVQGSVSANIAGCRQLDIARSGTFKGSASIENADIDGLFDGELTVTGRLLIRATGKVKGVVRYKEIEIERGGQIVGEIHAAGETTAEVVSVRPAIGQR
jgi:cytoskeletal protein CcmA (bactofilin family)